MANAIHVRHGWLKVMYGYTIVGAGGFGLGLLFMPAILREMFGWPEQDPVLLGAYASVLVAFGVLSAFGLRAPLTFLPVLLIQLIYKVVWFIIVLLPAAIAGPMPVYRILLAFIFATYVAGDLIAIPFPYVFQRSRHEDAMEQKT